MCIGIPFVKSFCHIFLPHSPALTWAVLYPCSWVWWIRFSWNGLSKFPLLGLYLFSLFPAFYYYFSCRMFLLNSNLSCSQLILTVFTIFLLISHVFLASLSAPPTSRRLGSRRVSSLGQGSLVNTTADLDCGASCKRASLWRLPGSAPPPEREDHEGKGTCQPRCCALSGTFKITLEFSDPEVPFPSPLLRPAQIISLRPCSKGRPNLSGGHSLPQICAFWNWYPQARAGGPMDGGWSQSGERRDIRLQTVWAVLHGHISCRTPSTKILNLIWPSRWWRNPCQNNRLEQILLNNVLPWLRSFEYLITNVWPSYRHSLSYVPVFSYFVAPL